MKPIEERINEFVERERTGYAIDIRTLKDAETAPSRLPHQCPAQHTSATQN